MSFDGSNKQHLTPRQAKEGLGHEYWTSDGSTIRFVHYPDKSGRRATVRSIELGQGKETVIAPCSAYGWLSDNSDSSAIVGASRRLSGPNIYVLFVRLGREMTLCEHGSSVEGCAPAGTQPGEAPCWAPEPFFSSDTQWVYFTSDREGKPAIYRMKIDDLAAET